jgi:carbonic anhydrase
MMDIDDAHQPPVSAISRTQETISQIREAVLPDGSETGAAGGSDGLSEDDALLRQQLEDLDDHSAKHEETMATLREHQLKLDQMRGVLSNASAVLGVHLEHAQARERNGTASALKKELERLLQREVNERVASEVKRLEGQMTQRMNEAIARATASLGARASDIAKQAIKTQVGTDVHKLLLEPPYKTKGPLVELVRDEVGVALDDRLENAVLKQVDNVTAGVVDGLQYDFDDVKSDTGVRAVDGDSDGNRDSGWAAAEGGANTRFRGSSQLRHRRDVGADGYRDSADEAVEAGMDEAAAAATTAAPGNLVDAATTTTARPALIRRDYSGQPDFTYDASDSVYGPAHWGEIDAAYRKCGSGHHQSPIDVRTAAVSSLTKANVRIDAYLQPLSLTYAPVSPTVIQNNGHAIDLPVNIPVEGVAPDEAGSARQLLQYGPVDYTLRKVNVHAPGEHSIDGRRPLMELHLIHEANSAYKGMASRWAIIIVPFFEAATPGDGDAFLDLWWDEIPPIGEQQVLDATALNLVTGLFGGGVENAPSGSGAEAAAAAAAGAGSVELPASSFYTYSGSLTTPPCSENARYFILKAEAYPHRVALSQVALVTKLLNGTNSRPIQNDHWDPTDPTDRLQVLTKGPWLGAPIGSVVMAPPPQQQQQQSDDTVATPPVLASKADQALLGEAAGNAADTVADLQASESR